MACASGGAPVGSARSSATSSACRCGGGSAASSSCRPVEQVDQRREREPGLGAASPRREHAQPALPGRTDARLPERRLPDSRLSRENERARPVRGSEELVQQPEFRLAADKVIALLRGRLLHVPRGGHNTAPNLLQPRRPEADGLERLYKSTPMVDAVLFDLFTALLDSQPLWRDVAGSARAGARWREESSRLAHSAGPYRPFVETVEEAARLAGVPSTRAADLLRGMGEQLGPWPEAPEVLGRLRESVRIGVVTNCSEELGQRAAARVGVHFDTVVTAEAAGAYKPRPEPYRLALCRLGVQPSHALFVAGSPGDITGAAGVGMRVWWHNRLRLPLGEHQAPFAEVDSLEPLLALATG